VAKKNLAHNISENLREVESAKRASGDVCCSLGAQHDGTTNDCKGVNQYVMASAPTELNENTFYNALTFSRCSINYFRRHFNKLTR